MTIDQENKDKIAEKGKSGQTAILPDSAPTALPVDSLKARLSRFSEHSTKQLKLARDWLQHTVFCAAAVGGGLLGAALEEWIGAGMGDSPDKVYLKVLPYLLGLLCGMLAGQRISRYLDKLRAAQVLMVGRLMDSPDFRLLAANEVFLESLWNEAYAANMPQTAGPRPVNVEDRILLLASLVPLINKQQTQGKHIESWRVALTRASQKALKQDIAFGPNLTCCLGGGYYLLTPVYLVAFPHWRRVLLVRSAAAAICDTFCQELSDPTPVVVPKPIPAQALRSTVMRTLLTESAGLPPSGFDQWNLPGAASFRREHELRRKDDQDGRQDR